MYGPVIDCSRAIKPWASLRGPRRGTQRLWRRLSRMCRLACNGWATVLSPNGGRIVRSRAVRRGARGGWAAARTRLWRWPPSGGSNRCASPSSKTAARAIAPSGVRTSAWMCWDGLSSRSVWTTSSRPTYAAFSTRWTPSGCWSFSGSGWETNESCAWSAGC